jgi:hypothetical protein
MQLPAQTNPDPSRRVVAHESDDFARHAWRDRERLLDSGAEHIFAALFALLWRIRVCNRSALDHSLSRSTFEIGSANTNKIVLKAALRYQVGLMQDVAAPEVSPLTPTSG